MPLNKERLPCFKDSLPHKVTLDKRRRITVSDLLARDDVNGILSDLDEVKPHIKDAVIIYLDKRDNSYYWQMTNGTLISTAVWMLESTKLDILTSDTEHED